ncbi:hypothetical protein EJ04DRAFT_138345 [Polyplosphaeria fusca]|uniref:Uncharacterized protein n=1 Tax=Polyplosphaeria fusca TaxID=682080 RepID=A0A9P4UWQ0_9PLEO|nr:hypothetical protein EJ04DRAFT_138345 [Polyplosphaeria fusca]
MHSYDMLQSCEVDETLQSLLLASSALFHQTHSFSLLEVYFSKSIIDSFLDEQQLLLNMCNGHSTRISQGGSIAILRSTRHSATPSQNEEWRLLFSNQEYAHENLASNGTQVELQGWSQEHTGRRRGYWVVIHSQVSLPPTEMSPFYSFDLNPSPASAMQLSQKLDLGVGDSGIIGRRVSVMTASTKGPTTVAEGIIGWN